MPKPEEFFELFQNKGCFSESKNYYIRVVWYVAVDICRGIEFFINLRQIKYPKELNVFFMLIPKS